MNFMRQLAIRKATTCFPLNTKMTPYYESGGVTIYHGDCREILPQLTERFDACITDPPYGLRFMGKQWDHGVPAKETWAEVLNVLKPGAHVMAFGGTRTNHRLACAIEDAGFEIRDMLMWLYGSGFPKSLDISKAIDKQAGAEREVVSIGTPVKRMIPGADQNNTGSWIKDDSREFVPTETLPSTESAKLWDGYGTALKPAYEPIIIGMKPLDGTFAGNALKHGVAGLNIDGSRIDLDGDYKCGANGRPSQTGLGDNYDPAKANQSSEIGRWPSNVILDEEVAQALDEMSEPLMHGAGSATDGKHCPSEGIEGIFSSWGDRRPNPRRGDFGGASRFFYTAKAGSGERSANMTGATNNHPTVKPLDLMRYLCRLVCPPRGGILLEPFMGSGSTVIAGRAFFDRLVACEIEERYCEIAAKRLSQEVLEFTR